MTNAEQLVLISDKLTDFGVITRDDVRWLVDRVRALEADMLTQEEAAAFLDLVDKPATYLHVHGWSYEGFFTPADRRAATKLRKIAGREP